MKKVAVVGDRETITGFKIAGVVESSNIYADVSKDEGKHEITKIFTELTKNPDVGIIFICKSIAQKIPEQIEKYKNILPSVMIIPDSKTNLQK